MSPSEVFLEDLDEFRNPIVPGFAPDPSVVLVDGVFYLATSSFHIFPGIPIYASTDLKSWTHIGMLLSNQTDHGSPLWRQCLRTATHDFAPRSELIVQRKCHFLEK